ncbi:MAG: site-specific DNA-methyltransferase [Synergistaceae bacterium]|jgi:DNA modification methylase|nr:site-specific DNA-methyltransferase [Synergistaceae bacterium]
MKENVAIYLGDARFVLRQIGDDTVDLIVTSPPYADQRKNTYGGISVDKYVEWFLPISKEESVAQVMIILRQIRVSYGFSTRVSLFLKIIVLQVFSLKISLFK